MAWKINRTRGPWQTEALSELKAKGHRRPIMLEIEPLTLHLRPKGTRQRVSITIQKVYELACAAAAEAARTRRHRTVSRGRV